MKPCHYARTAALTLALSFGCEKGGETASPGDVASEPSDDAGDFNESSEELSPRGSIEKPEDAILTVSGFEDAVNAHMQDVVDCFSDAKANNDKLGTKLVADFRIDGEGKVTGIDAIDGSDVDDAGLLTCIKDKTTNWGLAPPPGGEATNMTFPFDFTPA